ncbi:MAG: hypothetical protein KC619_06985 [Myxococcales bacterium]|nr:hypothetical protein [Myxococcales bacterium]
MRRTLGAALTLLLAACGGEGPADPPAPPLDEPVADEAPEVARSLDEEEPFEAPPSAELTGAPLAGMHEQALRDADRARGTEMLETACDRGFEPSCLAFAERLEAGDGIEADPERARGLFEASCMAGSTFACDRLGH